MFKKLELEWKIFILAFVLFVAIALPLQRLFVSRLTSTLEQSIDHDLEPLLRSGLTHMEGAERDSIVACLERHRQWKALIPIIINEQRRSIFGFSVALLLGLSFFAFWTLKRLTRPLKNLAGTVEQIGKGMYADVVPASGGALGTVEHAVVTLQEELGILREKARIQGMERAWQDIARVMAHEIKNPLTPIRLSLDRIEERVAEGENLAPETINKFLTRINNQLDVLERLVNQFRSFSREPEVHLKKVALHDAISSVSGDLAQKITTDLQGTATIDADPYLLNQILLNIWKNSLEAGAKKIIAHIHTQGPKIRLSIRDNGPGVKNEDRERIWLPYVSLKKGGTGLGLPVVKRLIETMGGTVSIESDTTENNQHLTVNIDFPQDVFGETQYE
ncbi:MAG: hypothetical protein GF401_04780 [Chitinivibrionales bacterium]|nr:hypothetical protein [Chitinivibrionales bacterium]